MKNNLINTSVIIICMFILIELIINKLLIFDVIYLSLDIWVKNLIPSLFPFFVISDILINYNITNYIPKFIKNFFKYIFNTKEDIITIFFLSLISGFPSNARNIRTYYDKKIINTSEANQALIFTHFANPIFVLSTTGIFFLMNEKLGIIILISLYLSNIILGILFRNKNYSTNEYFNTPSIKSQSFGLVFTNAIKKSIDTLLLILGILTCFLVISAIIINMINITPYNQTIIKGILEITMGLESLGLLNINELYKVIIATTFITFGGLSVHMQVISQLINTNIKYRYFLCGRIIGTLLAGFISYILYMFI